MEVTFYRVTLTSFNFHYQSTTDHWVRDETRKMLHKREYSAHATVPSEWFPQCNFA